MTGIKILLTVGEKQIADKLSKLLVEAQYTVDMVFNGNLSKTLFVRHSYDLVLIDFELPDISGCEVCQYIRDKDEYIPLFMFSTGIADHKFEAFGADVNDYLILAGDFRELLVRIKTMVKRLIHPICRESRIIAGDIVMDLDSREVVRGDNVILLSAKEFLLLQYLLLNKNRIVSRDDIVCNLWGKPSDSKEGRVAAFMHSLRMKVDGNRYQKVIYTVRGKGYMVAE
jgi:two-component system, OmpR family, copper resistance phosphate regulon response regulator CusR